MNPENGGQHIGLRHSILWRKSMFVNNDGNNCNPCHKQLNECKSIVIQVEAQDKAGPTETTKSPLTFPESKTNPPVSRSSNQD